ncbi:NfeD family protein [Rarobacter incanus]|uniref:Membrane protein implicated in regulation of membrane protease activity n=1 Tax=Rarobacter incanus TaxID=153494 RepID=A0A542SMI4_9MICO|nr:NfeD family protein [Rarobacter incanus]TQK75778.1 membrane protein implicated in regulation of membrane protease activity [Rarobacter incanus]
MLAQIDLWVWWLGTAIVLALVEVLSLDLVLLMFAGGAAAAAAAAGMGAPWGVQVAVFVAVAALLLFLLRPWMLEHLRGRVDLKHTNVHAYVGKEAVAVTDVDEQAGRVKLLGEVWSARTVPGTSVADGDAVEIVKIDGATAIVKPLHSSTRSEA